MALEKYTDPGYDAIDLGVEEKLGLPSGLLSAIRTKGERSNADQVSSAGGKTAYQVIPETRDAIIKKYKIDPWLSPENAALGAGYLLKEGLERNRGDVSQSIGEYVGGIDRKNWGPVTKSYINRVMTGMKSAEAMPADVVTRAYAAYRDGRMSPEDSAEFEADIQSGAVKLPLGASIKRRAAAPEGFTAPASVIEAYQSGKMTPEDAAEFEQDVAANPALLPKGVTLKPPTSSLVAQIPGQFGPGPVTAQPTPEVAPTIGERLVGAGEAGLSTITGLTGGALGMAGGAVGGLAGAVLRGELGTPEAVKNIEQAAAEGAQALTYEPRTAQGQQQTQAVGEVLQQAIPVMPLTGELAMAGRAAATAAPSARAAVGTAAQQAARTAREIPARVAKAVRPAEVPATAGTRGSAGAAGVDMATLRQAKAEELPVPIELTKGQKTRAFEQQRFEQEAAKNPELGQPLRERMAEQNQAMLANFDSFVDQTGAVETTARGTGAAIDKALRARMDADKAKIRVAYKNAEKAGEMESPVELNKVIDHLNDQAPEIAAGVSTTLQAARNRAVRLGAAIEGADGQLIPQPIPLKSAELFRRAISGATDFDPVNIRQSSILKGLIDEATDGVGGSLYKDARKLRSRLSQNYENIGLIKQLIGKKRGSSDRVVALEDVFDRSVLRGSLDDVRQLRRVLQTEGEQGTQAWKELQGATIRHIRDAATSNVARDIRGNEIVSAAKLDRVVRQLDADGKLDFIFGKKGGEQIRMINEIAKDVYTAPPGSINTSNTASVLMAALDMAISGTAGLPLPVLSGMKMLSKNVKDRKIRQRINEALRTKEKQPAAKL